MNKNGKSIGKEVTILVLAAIIIALIIGGGSISGLISLFNHPDIVRVAENNENVCPSTIWFNYDEEGNFKIKLRNAGSEGSIFVNISSDELLVRNNELEVFRNESKKSWRVPSQQYQDYEFNIQRKNKTIENITINIGYGCEGLFCNQINFCCEYTKPERESNYQFVGERC